MQSESHGKLSVRINLGGGLEHYISNKSLCHSDERQQTQALPVVLKCDFIQLWVSIFYSDEIQAG